MHRLQHPPERTPSLPPSRCSHHPSGREEAGWAAQPWVECEGCRLSSGVILRRPAQKGRTHASLFMSKSAKSVRLRETHTPGPRDRERDPKQALRKEARGVLGHPSVPLGYKCLPAPGVSPPRALDSKQPASGLGSLGDLPEAPHQALTSPFPTPESGLSWGTRCSNGTRGGRRRRQGS